MSFFTSLSDRVSEIRALTGEVPDAALLPGVVAGLDDAGAVELLGLAAAVGQMVERLRVAAAGVVAQRSTRAAGHAGLAQSAGHRSAVSLVQQVTGMSRGEAVKQVRVGESLYETAPGASLGVGSGACGRDAANSPPDGAGCVDGAGCADDAGSVDAPGGLDGGAPVTLWHAPLGAALLDGTITAAQHDAIFRGLGQPPAHDCTAVTDDGRENDGGSGADGAPGADSAPAPAPAAGPGPGHDCAREVRECAAVWSVAVAELIDEAGCRTVEDLARAARAVRDRLDPVGAEARYLARYEARSFRMWTDRDGLHRVALVCDDVSAAWWRSVRDAALGPRRGGPRFVDPAGQERARELVADPRTNEQLEFDLCMDLLRAGALADADTVYGTRQAGIRLVQHIGPDGVPGAGYFEDDPATIPAGVVHQQACTVGVVPVTIDRAGRPLDVGREQRLYTPRQRIALAVRDGGCRWTGCDRPPAYCEAHHIDEWEKDHGRTDLDRGILLCRFHHMQLHTRGWHITRDSGEDFALHDPGGRTLPMRPRIELRYTWTTGPPPRRFTLAA
jgi:hypothetical protein